MPLFRGPVSWADIKTLIGQGAAEHELLDYKEYSDRLSKRVVVTIAAMANTYGGDIVLGVGQDDYGKPKPLDEIVGVPRDQAAQIIESIEGQNWTIQPPVLGLSVEQVDVPPDDHPTGSADSCILVVRVLQSDLVPHWLPDRGHYCRAGSQNKPFRDVHLPTERIQWLLNRRNEHVAFRKRLLDWVDGLQGGIAWHKVWCVPLFPSPAHALWPLDERRVLDGSCPEIRTAQGPVPFANHGLACGGVVRTVQHGWVTQASEQQRYMRLHPHVGVQRRGSVTHVVDHRGLVVVKGITYRELAAGYDPVEQGIKGDGQSSYIAFDWYTVNLHLLGVCHQAAHIYASCGYRGPVEFGIELGVNPAEYSDHVYLGSTWPDVVGKKTVLWSDRVDPITRNASMAEPGGRVIETHDCLAKDLLDEVWSAVGQSAWSRAFNTEWCSGNGRSQRCVELLKEVFILPEP